MIPFKPVIKDECDILTSLQNKFFNPIFSSSKLSEDFPTPSIYFLFKLVKKIGLKTISIPPNLARFYTEQLKK